MDRADGAAWRLRMLGPRARGPPDRLRELPRSPSERPERRDRGRDRRIRPLGQAPRPGRADRTPPPPLRGPRPPPGGTFRGRLQRPGDRDVQAVGFEVEGIERDGVGTEDGFVDDVKMAIVKGRSRPTFDPAPVTLEGEHVRLVPLRMEHAHALLEAADEDEIWRWMVPRPKGLEGYERYIRWALDQQILGTQLPFAVIRKSDGAVVGTTRYAHIDPPNRTIEIGYTLYGKGARRTPVNTECKLLLLRHAFETLGANRVWLQTDKRNERSQKAIARLGATREGELRNERVLADGHLRTSVVFGITKEDWPSVRERLLGYLAR